jgi:hypothetical protein
MDISSSFKLPVEYGIVVINRCSLFSQKRIVKFFLENSNAFRTLTKTQTSFLSVVLFFTVSESEISLYCTVLYL